MKGIQKYWHFETSSDFFLNSTGEVAGDNKVKVTFENFLDFVVKSQGDGPDPYGEIKQVELCLNFSQRKVLLMTIWKLLMTIWLLLKPI